MSDNKTEIEDNDSSLVTKVKDLLANVTMNKPKSTEVTTVSEAESKKDDKEAKDESKPEESKVEAKESKPEESKIEAEEPIAGESNAEDSKAEAEESKTETEESKAEVVAETEATPEEESKEETIGDILAKALVSESEPAPVKCEEVSCEKANLTEAVAECKVDDAETEATPEEESKEETIGDILAKAFVSESEPAPVKCEEVSCEKANENEVCCDGSECEVNWCKEDLSKTEASPKEEPKEETIGDVLAKALVSESVDAEKAPATVEVSKDDKVKEVDSKSEKNSDDKFVEKKQ